MSSFIRGPIPGLTLRAADGPDRGVYVLLPSLSELLGVPGFAMRNPICLPGAPRPLDGWALFGPPGERNIVLH